MTPASIIAIARHITNDTGQVSGVFRQDDAELLAYVNEALKEAATLAPPLFTSVGDLTCATGKAEQSITYLDAAALLDVLCIHEGAALTPADRATLDQFMPSWRSDPPGPAQHWMPIEGDRLRFLIYPPAPAGQVLDVKYVRIPRTYAMEDVIADLPETFAPALADYVVYRAEMKDDEHVIGQRAAAHYTAFKTKLGVPDASL